MLLRSLDIFAFFRRSRAVQYRRSLRRDVLFTIFVQVHFMYATPNSQPCRMKTATSSKQTPHELDQTTYVLSQFSRLSRAANRGAANTVQ